MNYRKNLVNACFLFLIVSMLPFPAWSSQNAQISATKDPAQPSFFQNLTSRLLAPSSSGNHCPKPCKADDAALRMVQRFEGYSKYAYYDAVGIKTIGFGHAIKKGEHIQEPLTPARAQALLEKDMAEATVAVNKLTVVPLKQNEFNALLSFTFNLGSRTLKNSTLLKKANAGHYTEVPQQFLRYVYAGKQKLSGLVTRRQVEAITWNG